MEKRLILIFLATILMSPSLFAQQINLINPTMTPAQAVEDILLGAGIVASNITINGGSVNTANNHVRQFNSGTSNFPITDGIMLRTSGALGGI